MKQPPLLYVPVVADGELPAEEAHHAVHVLRLREGDQVVLTDGLGHFHQARLQGVTRHSCGFRVEHSQTWLKPWRGHIHLAIAPTKNIERMEWLCEKGTEIGLDELTLLLCDNSERKDVRMDRLEKIVVSAMKQSLKAIKPVIHSLTPLRAFVESHPRGGYICHCGEGEKVCLPSLPKAEGEGIVMIGPEGDFSSEEVALARGCGFQAASLGESRLRTETAGLVAIHLMQLMNNR